MRTKICLTLLLGLAACGSKHKDSTSDTNPGTVTNPNAVSHDGTGTFTGPQQKFFGHNGQGVGNSTIFAWSGSGVEVRASGELSVSMIASGTGQVNIVKVFIDGVPSQTITLIANTASYPITLPDSNVHTVRLVKITEAGDGTILFHNFTGTLDPNTETPSGRYIEIIGDSISAGYGILANTVNCPAVPYPLTADPNFEDITQSYGIMAAIAVNADWAVEAWSGKGVAHNNSQSDTVTMPTLWPLSDPTNSASTYQPDPNKTPGVVVINLGTNDWTTTNVDGNPNTTPATPAVTTVAAFEASYITFVGQVRAAYPQAVIFLAVGPMLSAEVDFTGASLAGAAQLTTALSAVQAVVSHFNAAGDSNVSLIQFTANTGTGDVGCDYHPNVAKQAAMATQLADTLRLTLNWD